MKIKIYICYNEQRNSLSIHQEYMNSNKLYYNGTSNKNVLIDKIYYTINDYEDHLFNVKYIPLKLENLYIKGDITLYSNDIKFPMEITFLNSILKEKAYTEHIIRIE